MQYLLFFRHNGSSQQLKAERYSSMILRFMFVPLMVTATLSMRPVQAAELVDAKWQIVNYWSEWCAPCRVEIPMLNELSALLSSSNIIIVGVNFDEDPREVTLEIAEDMGIGFPVLTLEEVAQLDLRPPNVLPTTYILSPTHEVVAKLIGAQTQQELLEQLTSLGLSTLTELQAGQ